MNRVLADGDPVAVVELLLLDRITVDERAVGAPEVDDPELLTTPLDACVVPARGRVAQDEVVVGRAPESEGIVAGAVGVAGVGSRLDGQLGLRTCPANRTQRPRRPA